MEPDCLFYRRDKDCIFAAAVVDVHVVVVIAVFYFNSESSFPFLRISQVR